MTAPLVDAGEPEFVEDILDDDGSPSPEAPAAEPAAPAETAAQPSEPVQAQPTDRDQKGRFAKKAKAIDGPGAPTSSVPSPEIPAPVPPVAGEATPPSEPAAPEPQPWTFNADKQPYHLEGAVRGDFGNGVKGLYIPDQHVDLIQQLIAEGVHHRGTWRDERASLQEQLEKPSKETLTKWREADPDVIRARSFNTALLGLLDQGPEAAAAWLDDFLANKQALIAKAENDVLQAELAEHRATASAIEEDRDAAALQPKVESSLQQVVRELAGREQFKGVNAAALYQRIIEEHLDKVVYEKSAAEGLAQGELLLSKARNGDLYVVNWGKIESEFAYQASILPKAPVTPVAAQVVAKNAMAVAQPAAVPATVPAAGSVSPTPAKLPIPKGKKEVEKWINSGKWKESFPD